MAAFSTVNLYSYTDTEDILHIHDVKVRPFLCVNVDKLQFVTFATANEPEFDSLGKISTSNAESLFYCYIHLISNFTTKSELFVSKSNFLDNIQYSERSLRKAIEAKIFVTQTCWSTLTVTHIVITPLFRNFGFTLKVQSFLNTINVSCYHQSGQPVSWYDYLQIQQNTAKQNIREEIKFLHFYIHFPLKQGCFSLCLHPPPTSCLSSQGHI